MTHQLLGPGAEFDRIRKIAEMLGGNAQGLGDDCALLEVGGETLAISTDVSVEGIHFRRDWLSLEEIGWRAAAGALSDLAAEGADAPSVVAALSLPPTVDAEAVTQLMKGVGEATAAAGGHVLGGDLSSSGELALCITVIGHAAHPVRRVGAMPGDGIWVTGSLGLARAALATWLRGEVPHPATRAAFARPEPRIRVGRWLAGREAHAMIDISDGLAGDARHLAAASGVRLELALDKLPVPPEVDAAAKAEGKTPAVFGALGGEDYELLVALPRAFGEKEARDCQRATRVPLTRIGEVVQRTEGGGSVIFWLNGEPVSLSGFDHFR
jgi:thiamine-monophosphate kinase